MANQPLSPVKRAPGFGMSQSGSLPSKGSFPPFFQWYIQTQKRKAKEMVAQNLPVMSPLTVIPLLRKKSRGASRPMRVKT